MKPLPYEFLLLDFKSRPARGAWIETLLDFQGMEGGNVAPRAGRVD